MGLPRSKRDIEAILRTTLKNEFNRTDADNYSQSQLTEAVERLVRMDKMQQGSVTNAEAEEIARANVLGIFGLSYDDWNNWKR